MKATERDLNAALERMKQVLRGESVSAERKIPGGGFESRSDR